jgi:hypothetical protein
MAKGGLTGTVIQLRLFIVSLCGAGDVCSSAVESLPCVFKALGSIPALQATTKSYYIPLCIILNFEPFKCVPYPRQK